MRQRYFFFQKRKQIKVCMLRFSTKSVRFPYPRQSRANEKEKGKTCEQVQAKRHKRKEKKKISNAGEEKSPFFSPAQKIRDQPDCQDHSGSDQKGRLGTVIAHSGPQKRKALFFSFMEDLSLFSPLPPLFSFLLLFPNQKLCSRFSVFF